MNVLDFLFKVVTIVAMAILRLHLGLVALWFLLCAFYIRPFL